MKLGQTVRKNPLHDPASSENQDGYKTDSTKALVQNPHQPNNIASKKLLDAEQLQTLKINPELAANERVAGEKLLLEFRDLFVTELKDMGNTHLAEHEIRLKPGAAPYYCPGTRRLAQAELKALRENIEEELQSGKIVQMDGPWCAPIVIVKKKDGGFRKCVAYNGLNDRTERESWPLPNIEEILERMAGHSWYSACDGFNGFYAVKMRKEDIEKTIFRTPFGTYAYTVMPFGLKNAPHTFSKVTYRAYKNLIGKTIEAYIDDTATYSDTFEEHLADLKKTFEATRAAGLKLKAKKCQFFYREIEFVGHIVGKSGIKMMPGKIERVQTWPIPKDKSDLKGFLGLASYYRRFIHGFAHIAVPLNRLTAKTTKFEWNEEHQKSFEGLKKALTSAPVITKPNYSKDWTLEVDASGTAMGGVLSQEGEDRELHPVYYWSKQLSKAEQNYSTTDRECLAVVAACKKFRPYILGRHVMIIGDHTAVKWILNKIDLSGKYARWKIILSEFDYEMKTRPGTQNANADAMSRIPAGNHDDKEHTFMARALHQKWAGSPWYGDMYMYLEAQIYAESSPRARERIRMRAKRFLVQGDALLCRDSDGGLKTCLTEGETVAVLKEHHDGATGGHFGRDITINRIRRSFWWPTLWKDVSEYVRTCDICQRYGPKEHNNPLQPYHPVLPFEYIFLDYIINLPLTSGRNRHIITMTEGLTKWVEAKAVREATARASTKFLMENVMCRFGMPVVVITDNGTHFKGEFAELCEKSGIQHRLATPYHPQTTGQDERTNGLLLGRIRKWRLEEYRKWDDDIQMSVFACNTRKVSTTTFSPMEALMGFTAGTASSLKFTSMSEKEIRSRMIWVKGPLSKETTAIRLRVLESLRDEVIRVKGQKALHMKNRFDKKVREREFKEGQEVLLYDSSLLKQWSRKLEERWNGPYTILWKGDLGAYTIDMGNGKMKTVSGDHLKPYHHRK